MAGTFEVYEDAGGKHRFRLKASNGQVIASSQGYESKAACLNGIRSVLNKFAQRDCRVIPIQLGSTKVFDDPRNI